MSASIRASVNSALSHAPKKPRRSTISYSNGVRDEDYVDPETQDVFLLKTSENLTSAETVAQERLFNELSESGINPRWISSASALQLQEGDPHFYVLPAFRGQVFKHLKEISVKVLGSSLVRECLHKGQSLPKWTHPVFSMNLTGAIVAVTGLSVEQREQLFDYVRWMNGNVSKTFHDAVTHLVTEKCVSKNDKYRSARLLKVPVLIPEWITDGWDMAQNAQFTDIAHPDHTKNYKLPIFSKMVICTSGISGAERVSLLRLIELHGGQSRGEMAKATCTHLATDNVTGEKYRKAREWKSISVVQIKWITACIDAGYILNEKHFDPVNRSARSSTQKPEAESLAILDESSILGPLRHTLNSQMQHTLNSPDVSMLSTSLINKTPATNPRTALLRKESFRRASTSFGNTSLISNPESANDPIDCVNEEIFKKDFDFLEGCMIWICGSSERKIEKWNRALDRCGATRGTYCDATHVVVVSAENDRHHLLSLQNQDVEVVVPEWFIECTRRKDLLPTDKFKWDPENIIANNATVVVEGSISSRRSATETPRHHVMSAIQISAESSSGLVQIAGRSEAEQLNMLPLKVSAEDVCLFSGVSFRIRLEEAYLIRHWTEFLTDYGGIVLDDSNPAVANYLLCPPVEWGSLHCRARGRFEKAVTILWIQHCKDSQRIIDPCSDPLFKPLPAVKDSRIFEGLVFGIIGFANSSVKEVLTNFITLFNGKVETSVVNKPRNGIIPCTHLIVGSDSNKIQDCTKKIPNLKVVDASWLLECIINDTLLQEANFSFKNVVFGSYKRSDDLWLENGDQPLYRNIAASDNNITFDNDITSSEPVSDVFSVLVSEHNSRQRQSTVRFNEERANPSPSVQMAYEDSHSSPLRIQPKLQLQGLTQALNGIQSPAENGVSTQDSSTLNISKIGRIIGAAAARSAQPECSTPSGRKRPSRDVPFNGNEESQFQPPPVKRIAVKTDLPVAKAEPAFIQTEMKPQVNGFSSQISSLAASSRRFALQHLQQVVDSNLRHMEEISQSRDHVAASSVNQNAPSERSAWEASPVVVPKQRPRQLPIVEWQPESDIILNQSNMTRRGSDDLASGVNRTEAYTEDMTPPPLVRNAQQKIINLITVMDDQSQIQVVRSSTVNVSSAREVQHFADRGSSAVPVDNADADSFMTLDPMSVLTSPPPSAQIVESRKIFLFTSVSSELKNQLVLDIESLGGGVSFDEKGIPDEVTHLLCGKLVRGTKLMGCLASARWLLTLEYVKESKKAGRWLPEQEFEWIEHVDKKDEKPLQIALAGRRWREKLYTVPMNERGAFHGYRFVLYASQEKANGLIPLIVAGKGEVIIRSQLKTSLVQWRPTHAVIAKPNANEWNDMEMRILADMGVNAYQLEFLAKFLLEDNFDHKSCLNHEFVAFLARRR